MASSPSKTTGGAPLLASGLLPPCGHSVVCIPARSEARRLPALFAALDQQRHLTRPLRVVLLLNNCGDRSLEVAEQAASKASRCEVWILERDFSPGLAHAGSARRAAMEAGAAWLEADGAIDGVLLTTDADADPGRGLGRALARGARCGCGRGGGRAEGRSRAKRLDSLPRFAGHRRHVGGAGTRDQARGRDRPGTWRPSAKAR